ncbi:MAG: methylated-DNA--[protein]-cysteine S-methyltransferase [Mariniblastus sp.]|nr:methylated-DNA--[protein]-cysteine S-methyltransferase [Mariniblastus sp.]
MNQLTEQRLLAFATRMGWVGLVHREYSVALVKFGFASQPDLHIAFRNFDRQAGKWDRTERDWVDRFQSYAEGDRVSFDSIQLDLGRTTPFQRRVLESCRVIPYGEVLAYGELAVRVGHPGAARAVGSVMRRNRHPILIPCHRVVASTGIGGFSSPQGVRLKERLLSLESEKSGLVEDGRASISGPRIAAVRPPGKL